MLKEIDDEVEAQEQDEIQLTESELRNRVKKWLYKRESEEELEQEGESGEVLADTFLQAKKGMNGENSLAKLFMEGFDKLAAGAARGIDNAGNARERAVEGGSEKAGAAISKIEHQKEKRPDAKEQEMRQEQEIEEVLGDIFGKNQSQGIEPSKAENEEYTELDGKKKNGNLKLFHPNESLDVPENFKSEKREKTEVKDKNIEENKENKKEIEVKEKRNKDINSEFRELMKKFSETTNKKVNHGLKLTKTFKEWIKENPSIDASEKHKYLEYYNNYEKQLPKLKLEELKEYVRQQHPDGECLATDYVNNRTKVPCQCAEGHIWETTPKNIKIGRWCPTCAGNTKTTLEELKEYVRQQYLGGECLATKYINCSTKVPCQCAEGHIWETTPNNIKRGHWCPTCAEGVSERVCRKIFETILNKEFPKSRPEWLVNDRGNQMELDGYNKELALAFEYQGRQHYKYNEHFHKSIKEFEQRKVNDKLKRELCKKNGVTLIEVPYTVEHNQIQDYIINKCKNENVDISEINKKVDYKELDVYSSNSSRKLKELKEFVRQQHPGGECLATDYVNNRTKLPCRCAEGHIWEVTPKNIKIGRWCPKCGVKKRAKKRRR